jgi:hypothetical protein
MPTPGLRNVSVPIPNSPHRRSWGRPRIDTNRLRELGVQPVRSGAKIRDDAPVAGLASSLLTSSPLEGV